MSSSESSEAKYDFTDLEILEHDPKNDNAFDDSQLDFFKSGNRFPSSAVFLDFDPTLKSDYVSKTWVCFPEYPFNLGLNYPFPPLITEFFKVTKLCFPQLMPMGWRLLVSLISLNQNYGLNIGIPEIAYVYKLRTHGSSRFVFHRKSDKKALVVNVSLTEAEWRNRFFFVRRSSIPDGESLPYAWVKKVQFETLVKISDENIKRVKNLWKIEENKRSFRTVSIIPSSSHTTEHSQTTMTKKKLFEFEDINSMLSIKEEKSGSPVPKSRGGLRSSKNKKRKSTEVIDLDSQSEGMEKICEGLKAVAEERKTMYADLQDVMAQKQTIHEKYTAVRQENLILKKENQDLKASIKLQVEDTIENAKHSAIISILQAKIQMASEAGDKGLDLWGKHVESWKQTLESMEGKEEATVLEKVAEKGDGIGTSAEAVEIEKDGKAVVLGVGDEGYDAQA